MVGNKCDMDEERVIPPEKGKHLADQLGERLPLSRRRGRVNSPPRGNPPCFYTGLHGNSCSRRGGFCWNTFRDSEFNRDVDSEIS